LIGIFICLICKFGSNGWSIISRLYLLFISKNESRRLSALKSQRRRPPKLCEEGLLSAVSITDGYCLHGLV
jgi:hypothetical protein